MRGRQLVDQAFAAQGLTVTPQVETDSVATLLALVGTGRWASIVPRPWLRAARRPAGTRVLQLAEPTIAARIVLVTTAAEPASVLADALLRSVADHG